MKMKAVPGGGYWLDVEGHRFEVVLDTTPREGVYGGLVNNREYFCRVDGKRLSGGPYANAAVAKARLAPLMERVQTQARNERERAEFRQMCERLFPAGVPENVLAALENYPAQPETETVSEPVSDESAETDEAETVPETVPDESVADSVPEPEPVNLDQSEEKADEKAAEETPSAVAAKVRASAAPAKRRTRTNATKRVTKAKADQDQSPRVEEDDEKVAVGK